MRTFLRRKFNRAVNGPGGGELIWKKTKQYRRNRPFTVNGEHAGVGGDLVDRSSGVVNRSNGGQHRIVHARRTGARARAVAGQLTPPEVGICAAAAASGKINCGRRAKSGGRR